MKKSLLLFVLFAISAVSTAVYSQALPSCGGQFIDNGGINAPYLSNSNETITICPNNPGEMVTVTFTSFNTETNFDGLYVYNGTSTIAPQIPSANGVGFGPLATLAGAFWGNLTGNNLPTFTSTDPSGCLTFVFKSDISTNMSGWTANITCGSATTTCYPPQISASVVSLDTAVLTWNGSVLGIPFQYEYVILPCGTAPTATTAGTITSSNTVTVTGLTPNICYNAYVRTICSATSTSPWSISASFTTSSTCSAPNNISSTNFTTSSATVAWDETGTAAQWEYFVVPCGTATPTATTVGTITTVNPVVVSGLNPSTCYNFYVRAICSPTSTSPLSPMLTFSTTSLPVVCGGQFIDNGGLTANYSNNSNQTTTICPNAPGEAVTVVFTAFNTEANWDALYVYNGNSTASPMIASTNPAASVPGGLAGGFWGTAIPGPFASTSADGCLTFVFRSDSAVNMAGWNANVICGSTPVCFPPQNIHATNITLETADLSWVGASALAQYEYVVLPCGTTPTATTTGTLVAANTATVTGLTPFTCYNVFVRTICSANATSQWSLGSSFTTSTCHAPSSLTATAVTTTSASLGWTENGTATQWEVIFLPCGTPAPTSTTTGWIAASANPFTFTGLTPSTCYTAYVRSICGPSPIICALPITFTTQGLPAVCGGQFIDNGGSLANYLNSSNETTTICPTVAGEVVTVTFSSFNVEANFDALYVYDGNSVTAQQIPSSNAAGSVPGAIAGGFWGTTIPGPFTSTSADGCLTFVFRSDAVVNTAGWVSNVSCGPAPTCATPNSVSVVLTSFTNANITWNSGTATQWEVIVQPATLPAPTATATGTITTVPSLTMNSLAVGVSYKVYVRAICSATDSSNWSFGTPFLATAPTPTNLPDLTGCDDNLDGQVLFNLTTSVGSSNPLTYYLSLSDAYAEQNPITNPTAFSVNIASTNVFVFIREVGTAGNIIMYRVRLTAYTDCNLAHNCELANSLCGALGVPFTNTVGVPSTLIPANNYGCLASIPNPTWFYMQISNPGTLNLTIEQSTSIAFASNNLDVDYIVYGPFTDAVTPCTGGLTTANIASCSFSAAPIEHPVINNTLAGQYYLIMTTNYSNQAGFIRITANSGSTAAINCSGIRMNAFLDTNSNGTQDAGEQNFPLGQFQYTKNSGVTHNITAPTGVYTIYENSTLNSYNLGYTIDPLYSSMYSVSVASYTGVSIGTSSGLLIYNFPITTLVNYTDLAVTIIPVTAPRAGFNYKNKVAYANLGNQTIASGSLSFVKNAASTIVSTSEVVTSNANGFIYNFTNLLPFEYRFIDVNMSVPSIPTVAIGQLLTNSTTVATPDTETTLANNNSNLTQVVMAAYDPNDKTESHGERILYSSFAPDDYLTYTIRFENTGSIEAISVAVNDLLDAKIDETSVKMVNASHNYVLDRVGNNLNWKFNNIQLPVSVANTEIGKGFITFKAKLKPGFNVGTIVPNTANIYFDTNPAITTNTFNTEFVATLANESFTVNNFDVSPNPANGIVNVNLKNTTENIESITVTDVLGKMVKRIASVSSQQTQFDVSDLEQGVYMVEIVTTTNLKQTKKLIVR